MIRVRKYKTNWRRCWPPRPPTPPPRHKEFPSTMVTFYWKGHISNKISCFVSTCVSLDNSFPSVRQEPSFGPWKGSPFLQQMATLAGTLPCWHWHPDHSGYSEASLPANGPDPAAATGTLSSLVSSWCGQLARVPRPVRNKRLYLPLSPSLYLSSP